MTLNSSGNLGIGITSPVGKLNIWPADNSVAVLRGNAGVSTSVPAFEIYTHNSSATQGGVAFNTFDTTSQERLRITYNGLVGINTSSPSERFEVNTGQGARAGMALTGEYPYLRFNVSSSSVNARNWAFNATNAEPGDFALLQSNAKDGNPVTAGTSILGFGRDGSATFSRSVTVNASVTVVNYTTGSSLFVGGAATNGVSNGIILLQSGRVPQSGSDTTGTNGLLFQHTISNATNVNGGYIYNGRETVFGSAGSVNTYLSFATTLANTNNEAMRITSDGNVGIGTTGPTAKIHVVNNTNGFVARFTGGVSSNVLGGFYANSSIGFASIGVQSAHAFRIFTTDADRFEVAAGGAVTVYNLGTGIVYSNAGTLTSTNPSDKRLKDNIENIGWGLNEILKLRPVSYTWKNDIVSQGTQFGFIAQEVQEVMPESVKEFGEEEQYLGLEKEAIYVTLVKAIQEQQVQIEELKQLINK
jgi:hypothetical protein